MLAIIILLKSIVNVFVILILNSSNNITQNFCFIYYKINYLIINYFENLLKNICINEIELKNFDNKKWKNI